MPSRLRDFPDSNFGTLNQSKNKKMMRYNALEGKFDLVDIDSVLGIITSIPNNFIQTVEQEIDIVNIGLNGIDAGLF